jgi:hypothetical protein
MRTYGEAVILATEQMKSSFASQNAYELEVNTILTIHSYRHKSWVFFGRFINKSTKISMIRLKS